MGKRSRLIGKIILADFLKYRLKKFINFVQVTEGLLLYKKLTDEGIIIRKPLLGAKIVSEEKESVSVSFEVAVIAKISKDVDLNFSIHYTNEKSSVEYVVDNGKLQRIINDVKLTEEKKRSISRLLHKLRRISTRNLITHEIIKGIVECQRDYFVSNSETGNGLDLRLRPLSREELARVLSNSDFPGHGTQTDCQENNHNRDFVIDRSRISRITQRISIITPQGNEVSLASFFPTKRDVMKRYIKVLLSREKEGICNGLVKKPYTDVELRCKLEDEYGSSITRREVAYCRKDLGILPYSERVNGYGYPSLQVNFSKIYPFTSLSVRNNAPTCAGVYELRLDNKMIEYPDGQCQTFYIGSGKNLRKRLLSHLSPNSKNGRIRRFVKERVVIFRYLKVPKGWIREERGLYNLFVTTFGGSPACNHVSPRRTEISETRS